MARRVGAAPQALRRLAQSGIINGRACGCTRRSLKISNSPTEVVIPLEPSPISSSINLAQPLKFFSTSNVFAPKKP
jgi:hypothetical protein